ncbi:YceI family protein [Gulosibacter hominis]|uniref:YceI family protein n=1 Tax=Gulosibacter hominis TaxID=2770504 RepID=UPI00191868C7|nr:YceI family protein [Gulosibacter hominis]
MTAFEGLTAGTYTIDPTHTEISFSVRHLAISKVRGHFQTFAGTVEIAEQIEDSTASATIDVASINTNQAQRDEHLRTSDFFNVEEFPEMTFKSTGVAVDGGDLTINGDLTLRGVTKPVTLEAEFGGATVDGYGNTKVGFEATTKINRQDFGVTWNAATEAGGLTLGDVITITIDAQLAKNN